MQGHRLDRLRGVNAQLSNQVRKLEASLAQINEVRFRLLLLHRNHS